MGRVPLGADVEVQVREVRVRVRAVVRRVAEDAGRVGRDDVDAVVLAPDLRGAREGMGGMWGAHKAKCYLNWSKPKRTTRKELAAYVIREYAQGAARRRASWD